MCELALVAFSSILCCRLFRLLVHFSMCCLSLPENTWWSRCAEEEQIKKVIVVRISLTVQPPARSWHFWAYNFDFPSQRYFSNSLSGYTLFYIPINHCCCILFRWVCATDACSPFWEHLYQWLFFSSVACFVPSKLHRTFQLPVVTTKVYVA